MMRWLLGVLLTCYTLTLATPIAVPIAKASPPVSSEARCAAWAVYDEARGEPLKGQRAVLDAILARMHKRQMSACQVVQERKQFQGYKPGVTKVVGPDILTRYEAVRKMQPVTANCEYFHATYVHPAWSLKMRRCKQVGKHIFYRPLKEKKHAKTNPNQSPATRLRKR